MVEKIEKYAKENNIPIIQKEGLEFISSCIKEKNIQNILEIGSAIGYSAIKMALLNKNIKITTIERDKIRYDSAVKNIKNLKLNNQIEIHNIDAYDYNDNKKYDMIFIDAAKAQYINFFEKFKDNLNPGGIIITDNLKFHGLVEHPENTKNKNTKQLVRKIKNYIEFLKNNKEFNTKFYEFGDGISISEKI